MELAFMQQPRCAIMRIEQLTRLKQDRFTTCDVVDDGFNRVKANVGKSQNTQCKGPRAMGVAIDKGVVSNLYKYNEVSRDDEPYERNVSLNEHTFQPLIRLDKLPQEMQELKLHDIVGTGDPTWYYFVRTLVMHPLCFPFFPAHPSALQIFPRCFPPVLVWLACFLTGA